MFTGGSKHVKESSMLVRLGVIALHLDATPLTAVT